MNIKKCIPYALLVLFAVSACKKADIPVNHPSTAPSDVDVYVSGSALAANGNTVATYWKNGAITKVGDSTYNTLGSVTAVVGTDVYMSGIVGTITAPAGFIPAWWKNNVITKLTDVPGSTSITGMAVSGGNVYLSGETAFTSGNNIALHWVNTAASLVIDSAAMSSEVGVGVIGADVYQTGFKYKQDAFNSHGVYIKNGQANQLPVNTAVFGMTTSASDLYLCGDYLGNDGLKVIAAYWKNGTLTIINDTTLFSNATHIAVSGNDVYVTGNSSTSANNPSQTQGMFWKNGKAINLPGNTASTGPTGIFIIGSDVYVTGQINGQLGYWKNGVPVLLGQYDPNDSIFIVARPQP